MVAEVSQTVVRLAGIYEAAAERVTCLLQDKDHFMNGNLCQVATKLQVPQKRKRGRVDSIGGGCLEMEPNVQSASRGPKAALPTLRLRPRKKKPA